MYSLSGRYWSTDAIVSSYCEMCRKPFVRLSKRPEATFCKMSVGSWASLINALRVCGWARGGMLKPAFRAGRPSSPEIESSNQCIYMRYRIEISHYMYNKCITSCFDNVVRCVVWVRAHSARTPSTYLLHRSLACSGPLAGLASGADAKLVCSDMCVITLSSCWEPPYCGRWCYRLPSPLDTQVHLVLPLMSAFNHANALPFPLALPFIFYGCARAQRRGCGSLFKGPRPFRSFPDKFAGRKYKFYGGGKWNGAQLLFSFGLQSILIKDPFARTLSPALCNNTFLVISPVANIVLLFCLQSPQSLPLYSRICIVMVKDEITRVVCCCCWN